jgi:hypothetical protein
MSRKSQKVRKTESKELIKVLKIKLADFRSFPTSGLNKSHEKNTIG